MEHRRILITSAIFLILILFAILLIGPKTLEKAGQYYIDTGASVANHETNNYECQCINKQSREVRTYTYVSENEDKSMCHATICREMFGKDFYVLQATALNRNQGDS